MKFIFRAWAVRARIATGLITDTERRDIVQKSWIAQYPGDKDGMARLCINVQIPLRQEMLLKLLQMAVMGFQNAGHEVLGPAEGTEGPVFRIEIDRLFHPKLVSIPILAAGLQAIFNPRRQVNHNLRNRIFTTIFTEWGHKFLDTNACVALVRLGWGEDV